MIPIKSTQRISQQLLQVGLGLGAIVSLFYAQSIFADPNVPTLDQVVNKITGNIPQLMQAVTGLAYILGMYFVINGVIEFKHFGEARTQMSSEGGIKKPLLYTLVGAALIYLPSTISTGLNTLWTTPNPLAYVTDKSNPWSLLVGNSFLILQFIGVVAFIRGLIILTHLGGHGGQPGTFAKGMTHIIGGILCVNMYDTVRMIAATFGLDSIIS